MQPLRMQRDRIFLSLAGVLIISQLCLGLNDTEVGKFFFKPNSGSISAVTNPKRYFVSEIAPLFANWEKNKDNDIEQKINEVFKNLNVEARLVKNSIQTNGDSFEFLVYVPKYKRSFLVKYTPLVDNLAQLVHKEEFRLELKLFSSWISLPLDRLFG